MQKIVCLLIILSYQVGISQESLAYGVYGNLNGIHLQNTYYINKKNEIEVISFGNLWEEFSEEIGTYRLMNNTERTKEFIIEARNSFEKWDKHSNQIYFERGLKEVLKKGKDFKIRHYKTNHLAKMARSLLDEKVKKETLKLECNKSDKEVNCRLVNLGTQNLTTLDPLSVSNSIYCIDISNQKKLGYISSEQVYSKIIIAANSSFSFSFKPIIECNYKIGISTSGLSREFNYKERVILGNLRSDFISTTQRPNPKQPGKYIL